MRQRHIERCGSVDCDKCSCGHEMETLQHRDNNVEGWGATEVGTGMQSNAARPLFENSPSVPSSWIWGLIDLQFRILDAQRSSRRAPTINQNKGLGLDRVGGQVQFKGFLEQSLPNSGGSETDCRGFLKGQVLGDLDLNIPFGDDVFGKRPVFGLHRIAAMRDTGDAIPPGPLLGHGGADFLDDAGKVAPKEGAVRGEAESGVFPVRRVERHSHGFDEKIVISQFGSGPVGDQDRFFVMSDDSLHVAYDGLISGRREK